jgi:hypothetical protein
LLQFDWGKVPAQSYINVNLYESDYAHTKNITKSLINCQTSLVWW